MSIAAILPIAGVPDELLRALNDRFRQLDLSAAATAPPAGAPGLAFGHAERPSANLTALGTFGFETDRTSLYQVQTAGSVRVWRYVGGTMSGRLQARPADLTSTDSGFEYNATDALAYRWTGSAWTTATPGNTVLGASALTHAGAIAKVSAAGTLGESALTDDGTNLTLARTIAGAVQPTLVLDSGIAAKSRVGRVNNSARTDLLVNLSYDGALWNLDDITQAGIVVTINPASGLLVRYATAGANPRTLAVLLQGDVANGRLGIGIAPSYALDATGDLNASGVLRVAGTQVVAARGAALTATGASVAGSAGATYTSTEQAILNNAVALANRLKVTVDQIQARLQAHGLIT